MQLYIATTNQKKINEISAALQGLPVELVPIEIEFDEWQTDDMEAISRSKAAQAFEIVRQPVIVDDSGNYIAKYRNFPGVYAKPVYDGIGYEGLRRLIDEGDEGYFQTVISYMDDQLQEPCSFVGRLEGTFSLTNTQWPTIDEKMPYNFIFKMKDESRFNSDLPFEEFAARNQRGMAARLLREFLLAERI